MSRGGTRPNAGRKSGWNHGETRTIRVPTIFAEQLLEIARRLDQGDSIKFVTQSKKILTQNQDETVTKSTPKKDLVTKSKIESVPESLSQRQLFKRLHCDSRRLSARRDDAALLASWTKERDPDGVAWRYNHETGNYHPVLFM